MCGKGWLTECVGETLGRLARQLDGEEATVSDSQHTAEQLATYSLSLMHTHTQWHRNDLNEDTSMAGQA